MYIDKQEQPQSWPQHHKALEENTSTNQFVEVSFRFFEVAMANKEELEENKQESSETLEEEHLH